MATLIKDPPPGASVPPILAPQDGHLFLDRGRAAWRNKPSWYLIATDDKMIPPAAQELTSKRAGSTVAQVRGSSHAVYVSQPQAVAALIEKAANGVRAASR